MAREVNLLKPLHKIALPILREHGYFPEWAISGVDQAALIRKHDESVCYYFALRGRPGIVMANCYVAPPAMPDAGMQFPPSVHIPLGECHTFESDANSFITAATQRQVEFSDRLAEAAQLVKDQLNLLDAPENVLCRRRALEAFHLLTLPDAGEDLADIRRVAHEVAKGQTPEDHLHTACVPLVKSCRNRIVCLDDPVFHGKARRAAAFLAPIFYIEAVTNPGGLLRFAQRNT